MTALAGVGRPAPEKHKYSGDRQAERERLSYTVLYISKGGGAGGGMQIMVGSWVQVINQDPANNWIRI